MSNNTLTPRSKKSLQERGYIVWKAEWWNSFARKRMDMFGFQDLQCIHPNRPGVLGVQVTSRANMSTREKKMRSLPAFRVWLQAGNRVEIHGWKKVGGRWTLKVRRIVLNKKGK